MIGRICLKIAGRDSGKLCVIIDTLDNKYVMIDGETRRKKCNLSHLEFIDKKVDISKNASHEEVVKVFKELKIEIKETTPKKAAARQKKKRVLPRKKVVKVKKAETKSAEIKVKPEAKVEKPKEAKLAETKK